MAGLLGRKIGMTQVFGENGEIIPVTVIEAGPCTVLEVEGEKNELLVGFGEVKPGKLKKPRRVYFEKKNLSPRRHLKKFSFAGAGEYQPGQEISVDIFKPGDYLDVTGTTKGRGYSGTIRRWNASRWPMTHGHPEHRRTGSIGSSATPGRVVKGKRMPGHYGCARQTVQNLKVVEVRPEENLLLVKGAVPGSAAGLLVIRRALKKAAAAQ